MSDSTPTLKGVADEAEFQLICAKEYLSWQAAIARAIARDVEVAGGRDTAALIDLINFLDDTNFGSIDQAIDQFKAVSAECATQNAQSQNVSRTSRVRT